MNTESKPDYVSVPRDLFDSTMRCIEESTDEWLWLAKKLRSLSTIPASDVPEHWQCEHVAWGKYVDKQTVESCGASEPDAFKLYRCDHAPASDAMTEITCTASPAQTCSACNGVGERECWFPAGNAMGDGGDGHSEVTTCPDCDGAGVIAAASDVGELAKALLDRAAYQDSRGNDSTYSETDAQLMRQAAAALAVKPVKFNQAEFDEMTRKGTEAWKGVATEEFIAEQRGK